VLRATKSLSAKILTIKEIDIWIIPKQVISPVNSPPHVTFKLLFWSDDTESTRPL